MLIKELKLENKYDISSLTVFKLALEKFRYFIWLKLWRKSFSSKDFISKFDKSKENKEMHPSNIFFMLLTLSVLKCDKLILTNLLQL